MSASPLRSPVNSPTDTEILDDEYLCVDTPAPFDHSRLDGAVRVWKKRKSPDHMDESMDLPKSTFTRRALNFGDRVPTLCSVEELKKIIENTPFPGPTR